MSTSGPNIAGTGADDSSVGTVAWTNPSYITTDDTNYASANGTSGALTHYLKGTGFGFSIPSDATIDGITVLIHRYASLNGSLRYVLDNTVKLVVGGSVTGDSKADTSNKWPVAAAEKSYGGVSDKWGLTPTPANVNGSDFGAVINTNNYGAAGVTGYVNYIKITITYTPAPATYNEAVTVTRSAGITEAGVLQIEGGNSLAMSIGISSLLGLELNEAFSLARSAGVSDAVLLALSEAVSLARAAGISDAGLLILSEAVSLARSAGVSDTGILTLSEAISLARSAGVSDAVLVELSEAISLARSAGVSASNNALLEDTFSLALILAITTDGSLSGSVWYDTITLARSLRIGR